MRYRITAFFLTAMLLTGCTMIPGYNRPASPVPETWPDGNVYQNVAGDPNAPLAKDLDWQIFFTDPALQAIIESALRNNRDLRLAALNVERARAMYRIQRNDILPKVDATGSSYRQRIPYDLNSSGESMVAEEYRAEVGISAWEVDLFGRIRSLSRRALEEYLATEEARRGARILLISEVANAWLTLAADRENLNLAQSTLESQQSAYDLIRRRVEVGLTAELDLHRIQTRVDAARVDVARFSAQMARDINALNFLVGDPVPADLYPQPLKKVAPMAMIYAGATSDVLLERPDIHQAERRLKAAYANIGAARAAFFPRISLTTALGSASAELDGLFESGSRTWTVAPRATLPIFDPRIWSALKVSKVDREIALTRYEKTIQSAFREVADVLARKGTLDDQLDAQQSLVTAAEATYRLSNIRYEKGTDIYLNVLDAQRSLYAAQQGMISLRLGALANQIQLYAMLGGGGNVETTDQDTPAN